MMFNTTFINISVTSWRSVLLAEETGVPVENIHRQATSHWQTLSHNECCIEFFSIELFVKCRINSKAKMLQRSRWLLVIYIITCWNLPIPNRSSRTPSQSVLCLFIISDGIINVILIKSQKYKHTHIYKYIFSKYPFLWMKIYLQVKITTFLYKIRKINYDSVLSQ